VLKEAFLKNLRVLTDTIGSAIARESMALESGDLNALSQIFDQQLTATAFPEEPAYSVFLHRYRGLYLSALQCAELDSLRYAMNLAHDQGQISEDEHRWLLVAAAVAMSKCTTSTGHFAQPLSPKLPTLARYVAQRRRSLSSETWTALSTLFPLGDRSWRKRNQVFRGDALDLLASDSLKANPPRVVYADPPYTADQYSRYYHLYETWVLYDRPSCEGNGRYRGDRASSAFSCAGQATGALRKLIELVASHGADLILSYPAKGVIRDSESIIVAEIERHYKKSPSIDAISHSHSTMGGSKGAASNGVYEKIYRVAA
jgi:adenine-specific DNA-methyltransferase